jgi:hypothetical protein
MHTMGAFLQQARNTLHGRHLSIHSENTYLKVIRRFIALRGNKHPATRESDAVRQYLTCRTLQRDLSAKVRPGG